jgi:hypothetical protein
MAGLSMQIIDYLAGGKAGLEGRLLGSLPMVQMTNTDADVSWRSHALSCRVDVEPDAILLNRRIIWRVLNARTLAVSTGEGASRCEVRLILDVYLAFPEGEAGERTLFDLIKQFSNIEDALVRALSLSQQRMDEWMKGTLDNSVREAQKCLASVTIDFRIEGSPYYRLVQLIGDDLPPAQEAAE